MFTSLNNDSGVEKEKKGLPNDALGIHKSHQNLNKEHFNFNFIKKIYMPFLVQPNFLYMSGSKWLKKSCLRGDFRIFSAPFCLDSNEILPSFSMTSCTLYWKKDYLFSLVKYCYSSQIKVIVYKSCGELSLLFSTMHIRD